MSSLLVLKPADGKILSKAVDANTQEKVRDYDKGYWFHFEEWDGDFKKNIRKLLDDPDRCFVLGEPAGEHEAGEAYRRTKLEQSNGYPATIRDRDGTEIVLDLDGIEIPDWNPLDPIQGIEWVMKELQLSGISVVWQITAGQKLDTKRARIRLYLECSTPLSLAERKAWLKELPLGVDGSVYTCNQIIYTLPPEIMDGNDFIPVRHGFIDGKPTFSLKIHSQRPDDGSTHSNEVLDEGTADWLEKVMKAENFHSTMNRRAMHFGRLGLSQAETRLLMEGAMKEVRDKDERWNERYKDITRSISTGFAKLTKPRPIPKFDYEYVDLPRDLIPTVMADAATEISRVCFSPFGYAANGFFPVIGTSIGGNLLIEERPGILRLPINANEIFTDKTGEYKSALFEQLFKPVNEYEAILKKKWKDSLPEIQAHNEYHKKMLNRIKSKIGSDEKGNEVVDPKNIIKQMTAANASIREIPIEPKLFTQDATDEGLALACKNQGGCIAMATSEGGEVVDILMGKYKDDGKKGNVFFLKAVVGDKFVKSRASAEEFSIERPVLNSLIFIQPSKMAPLLSDDESRAQGVLARFGISTALSRIGKREIVDLDEIPLVDSKVEPFKDLIKEQLEKRFDRKETGIMTMGSDARKLWLDIYNRNEKRLGGDLKEYVEEVNKLTSKTVKKAAMLHIIDGRSGPLRGEYLEAADLIEKHNIAELIKLRMATSRGEEYSAARQLLGWIIKSENRYKNYQQNGFTKTTLKDSLNGMRLDPLFESALGVLSIYKWLTIGDRGRYFINFSVDEARHEFEQLPN